MFYDFDVECFSFRRTFVSSLRNIYSHECECRLRSSEWMHINYDTGRTDAQYSLQQACLLVKILSGWSLSASSAINIPFQTDHFDLILTLFGMSQNRLIYAGYHIQCTLFISPKHSLTTVLHNNNIVWQWFSIFHYSAVHVLIDLISVCWSNLIQTNFILCVFVYIETREMWHEYWNMFSQSQAQTMGLNGPIPRYCWPIIANDIVIQCNGRSDSDDDEEHPIRL